MNRKLSPCWKAGLILGLFGLTLAGSGATVSNTAAPPPRPQCGPIGIWDCTLRNGKHQTIEGTVCDIQKFEKKKKAVCVRAGS